jgi:general secretion pathway protein C
MSDDPFNQNTEPLIESAPRNRSAQFGALKDKLKNQVTSWNLKNVQRSIRNFDPQAFSEWASRTFQKSGTNFYGIMATIVLSTYFLSDLTALVLGDYIPEPMTSRSRSSGNFGTLKSPNTYATIYSRNLFNSQGLIPGDEVGANADPGGTPVRTSLPLNLIGTLIMTDELRSIATIEDKGVSIVYPVRIDDEIPNKIKILKIEPRKVIFLNTTSNRREYIELPEDSQIISQNPRLTPGRGGGGAGIEKIAPTQFNVARTEVDKALADFNNILTQARAVPNFENGTAAGYKLFQIVPGSIYDKLGLQNGDVIAGLNGQPINDPAKAFELLSDLKTANHLELQVKKDGRQSTYTYDIR